MPGARSRGVAAGNGPPRGMREQRELMIMSDERDKGPGMAYETSMWLDIFLEGAPPKVRDLWLDKDGLSWCSFMWTYPATSAL